MLVFEVTVPERATGVGPWGEVTRLSYPGLPALATLPIRLPLPRTAKGFGPVAVEPLQCVSVSKVPKLANSEFLEFQTGRPLKLMIPRELGGETAKAALADGKSWPESSFVAGEVQWTPEPHLPLALFVERLAPGGAGVVECSGFRISVTLKTGDHGRTDRHPLATASQFLDGPPGAGKGLIILTTADIVAKSEQLAPFMELKQQQGFAPVLVTLEEILANDVESDLSTQHRIRSWLRDNYQELGARYLLIIGDPRAGVPNSVPMQTCYPARGYDETQDDVPTDMYYSDLTGNWDWNGNGTACELEDYINPETGKKVGGVDLTPELLVGRIPHQGSAVLFTDRILKRTILYQTQASGSWTNRVLLPSPQVTFPDGNYVDITEVARYLGKKVLLPNGIGAWILGEAEGNLTSSGPYDEPLTPESMASSWERGYGVTFWCAHGSEKGSYRDIWAHDKNGDGLPQQMEVDEPAFIWSEDFFKLVSEEHPSIVFQASCLNAMPEDGFNLTHALLQCCSIANIASVRITMGLAQGGEWVPSPFTPGAFTMGVYFVNAMMTGDTTVSDAFETARGGVALGVEPWTFKMRLEFNLYGDPTTRKPLCTSDADCDDGSVCTGSESCVEGGCRAGTALVCPPAADLCSRSICDPVIGCSVLALPDGDSCNDGSSCTITDRCMGGLCSGVPRNCAVENPCVSGYCDPVIGDCAVKKVAEGTACSGHLGDGFCHGGYCEPAILPEPEAEPEADVVQAELLEVGETIEAESSGGSSGCAMATVTEGHQSGSGLLLLASVFSALACAAFLRRKGLILRP